MSFCTECGSENTKEFFTGKYDAETGARVMIYVCPNEKCHIGCGFSDTGHSYAWFSHKCRRCGHIHWMASVS